MKPKEKGHKSKLKKNKVATRTSPRKTREGEDEGGEDSFGESDPGTEPEMQGDSDTERGRQTKQPRARSEKNKKWRRALLPSLR
jgi:hypothetical protein